MYLKYCKIFWLLALTLNVVSAQTVCLTPYNTYGRCVPPEQCDFLQKLFTQYGLSLPQQFKDDVLKARCPSPPNSNKIYLCCEDSRFSVSAPQTSPPIPIRPASGNGGGRARPTRAGNTPLNLNERGLSILRSQKCGSVGGEKVSGGENADLFEYPWMALLRYNSRNQPFQCGGTLITNSYVLTAAHCVIGITDALVGVRLGEYNTASEEDCVYINERSICAQPVEDYGIANTIAHPDFSTAFKVNDVALIKLDRIVKFKQHIKPICLPISQAAAKMPRENQFIVAGWGTTQSGSTSNILQRAVVPFKTQPECQRFFRLTRITPNHICAGGEGIVDSCKGDSGGPLFYLAPYNTSQRYVQYGIVSFGSMQCGIEKKVPGIYANVVSYMAWITENID